MRCLLNFKQWGFFLIAIILSGLFIGCAHVDRIVIDGETALRMEHAINDQLVDIEFQLRGNTASNIRNGGYILEYEEMLYFIQEMSFPGDETLHYLQELPVAQVGSLTARNELIAEIEGTLIGFFDRFLLYLDHNNQETLTAFDVEQYITYSLFPEPLSGALLLDRTVYLTTENGDLYTLVLGIDVSDNPEAVPHLITEEAGTLAGVADGYVYVIAPPDNTTIKQIDVNSGMITHRVTGNTYQAVQIAGSWIFFMHDNRLMRQPISGGPAVHATIQTVEEYAVCEQYLVFTSLSGGLYLSHLDGSQIVKLSDDIATGLQLFGDRLFYRNAYDNQALYTIDLQEGVRSSLLGDMVTDGGIQFEQINQTEAEVFLMEHAATIEELAKQQTSRELYTKTLSGPFLIIEIPPEGSTPTLFRKIDDYFSPDEAETWILITYKPVALGKYTDGSIAYRVDAILTAVNPETKEIFISCSVPGRPPSEIKHGKGDRYGLIMSWHQRALDMIQRICADS
jgi:hypothetical protein